jgi:flavin-dependent dehydrogenase
LSSWNSEILIATDSISDSAGPGWRLDRSLFDADLRSAARQAGATYRTARVREVQRHSASWTVRFDDGGVERARWIVDASGRRSVLARRLGIKRLRGARLIALYAIAQANSSLKLNRTVVEAVRGGWWYAARLPSGEPIAGFHTYREMARNLVDLNTWKRIFKDTQHIASMLLDANFDCAVQVMDAGGARLAQFSGDGWIACGDAAMSFDPISGQGIFSALESGKETGLVLADALSERDGGLRAYSKRLETAWQIYRTRCRGVYRMERRWITEPFWCLVTEGTV